MGKGLMKWKGIKAVLAVVALLMFIQAIAIIMQAKWLAETISGLFVGESLYEQFGRLDLFLCALLARYTADMAAKRLSADFAERTGADLRQQLLHKLMELGPRYAAQNGTGKLVTLVREGIGQFRGYVEKTIPRLPAVAIIPSLVWGYILLLDKMSALILAGTLPILIVFMILVGLAAGKQMEVQMFTYRRLSNHFVDSVRGLETLKWLGRSKRHEKVVRQVSERYRTATMHTLRIAFLSSFSLEFFTMLSVALVAVGLGLRLIQGDMQLVTALTVLLLTPEYFMPVRLIGADYHATLEGREAGDQMWGVINSSQQTMNKASQPMMETSFMSDTGRASAAISLKLADISLLHPDSSIPALSRINLELNGPQTVGIIGESGAGKSTLIDVIGGFLQPDSGEIMLNGVTGDGSLLTTPCWRKQIAYIPQHPYIFAASLADNIRFYAPEVSDEEVVHAMAAVGMDKVAASLPQGMHTFIGGGGRQLSGGQEQRIALARAFLSKRPVLLLDEPTAHLDIETEYELKKTMLRLFTDKLVVLATHRYHWLDVMDQVIVLEHGSTVEGGVPADLLAVYDVLHVKEGS